jgi:hypothetical protein
LDFIPDHGDVLACPGPTERDRPAALAADSSLLVIARKNLDITVANQIMHAAAEFAPDYRESSAGEKIGSELFCWSTRRDHVNGLVREDAQSLALQSRVASVRRDMQQSPIFLGLFGRIWQRRLETDRL